MIYKIDHDYHIHSVLSDCSRDPEQNCERMLNYAKEQGLTGLCLTDHFWDELIPGASDWYSKQDYAHIRRALPLPRAEGIDFLFGCETDMDKNFTVGISAERAAELDFIIVPTTHLHMTDFTISAEDAESNARRAELWTQRLEAVLNADLPFRKVGIAHLVCNLFNKKSRPDYLQTLDLIPSEDMERLFTKAAELGCGIELNKSDMSFGEGEENTVLRPFRIAKACGCKFYLGSDAHHPKSFDTVHEVFERAVRLLELTEADKYHIER